MNPNQCTRTFVIGYRHDRRLGLWQHNCIYIDAVTIEGAMREFEKAYPRARYQVDYYQEVPHTEQDHEN
jgi:hypothetical protein